MGGDREGSGVLGGDRRVMKKAREGCNLTLV